MLKHEIKYLQNVFQKSLNRSLSEFSIINARDNAKYMGFVHAIAFENAI